MLSQSAIHSVWQVPEKRKAKKEKKKTLGEKSKGYTKFSGRKKTGIVIIGGGMTGISSAYFLSKEGYDVTLLEAHELAGGATGMSSGAFTMGDGRHVQSLVKKYGTGHARKLMESNLYALTLLEETVKNEKIKCSLERTGSLSLASKPSHKKILEKECYIRKSLGFESSLLNLKDSKFHTGLFSEYCRTLNPVEFVKGLAKSAAKYGADIHEHSAVRHIYTLNDRAFIKTEFGELEAEKIIIATDSQTYTLGMGHNIIPHSHSSVATEKLSKKIIESIFSQGKPFLTDTYEFNDYFRLTPDNRIIIGSGNVFVGHTKNDSKEWHENEVNKQKLHAWLQGIYKIFPQLSNVKIEYVWNITSGYTFNGLPVIGPDYVHRHLIHSYAYGEFGLPFAFLSGKLITEYFKTGNDSVFEIFNAPHNKKSSMFSIHTKHSMLNTYFNYKRMIDRL